MEVRAALLALAVTLALGTRAEPGGILDSLQDEGFKIRGPRWK